MALQGNKFDKLNLYAPQLSTEVNYTDWTNTPITGGSSYANGYANSMMGDTSGSYINKLRKYTGYTPIDTYSGIPNLPSNNPYQSVDNYKYRLQTSGQEVPERKGVGLGSVLMTVLDVMQRPQYAITNVVDNLTDGDKSNNGLGDTFKALGQGITGERKSSFKDTLDNMGYYNDPTKKWYQGSNLGRNILGFAGDVLLDPTTYLTGGGSVLAKTAGKKALKESLTDVFEKGGVNTLSKTAVASRLGDILGVAEKDVMTKLNKFGKDSDTVGKLALGLSQSARLGNADADVANLVLDSGLKFINRDTLSDIANPLKEFKTSLTDGTLPVFNSLTMDELKTSINRSTGSLLNTKDKLKPLADLETLTPEGKASFVEDISKVLSTSEKDLTHAYSYATRGDLLAKIYDVTDHSVLRASLGASDTITNREYEVLSTLYDAFGDTLTKGTDYDTLLQNVSHLSETAGKTSRSRRAFEALGTNAGEYKQLLTGTSPKLQKVDSGIEFANGIRRVLDKSDSRFYIKYHNPFTNKVVPLIDVTALAPTKALQTAWSTIIEANPIRPIGDTVGALKHTFMTEGVDKRVSMRSDGTVDTSRYDAIKWLAKRVTDTIRMETGIPKESLEVVRVFNSIPKFLQDTRLQDVSGLYIERNKDDISKLVWKYISGDTTPLSETQMAIYKDMVDKGFLANFDGYKLRSGDLATLQKVAGNVTIYNEAIAQYDKAMNIDFSKYSFDNPDMTENYIQRLSTGDISEDELQSYMRHYYDYSPTTQHPTNLKGQKKNVDVDEVATLGSVKGSDGLSGTTGAYKSRRFSSQAMAMYYAPDLKPKFNIVESMARRNMESQRVALNKQFAQMIDDGIKDIDGFGSLISTKNFDGAEKVSVIKGKLDYYAHPEVAHQLKRVTEMFDSPSVLDKTVKDTLISVANGLKTLQTTYNPSFTWRNMIGEPMMNWIAGVSNKSNATAWKILQEAKNLDIVRIGNTYVKLGEDGSKPIFREFKGSFPGTTDTRNVIESLTEATPGDISEVGKPMHNASYFNAQKLKNDLTQQAGSTATLFQVGINKYTARDIMEMFNEGGLGWSGVSKGNLSKNMNQTLQKELKSSSTVAGKVTSSIENVGDTVETYTRLAQFIDCLDKGMDKETALREVRKFHVDYRDLTTTERKLFRNIAPYYTYMRKNLPIQVRNMWERQNKLNVIGQLVDSAYEAVQTDNFGDDFYTPDYLKEGLAIPLNIDGEGNVKYLNWGLPISDLGRLKYNMKDLFLENVFSMFSPMIKAPLEGAMNKDMMFGSDIVDFEGQKQPLVPGYQGENNPLIPTWIDTTLRQLGTVSTARNAIGQGMQTAQETGSAQSGIASALAKYLTGGVLPEKNSYDVETQQAFDYRDELYDYIKRLEQDGKYVKPSDTRRSYTPLIF